MHNILSFCDKEAAEGELLVPLSQATKRASVIAGVSVSTMKRIRQQAGDNEDPDFLTPKKKGHIFAFSIPLRALKITKTRF